MSSRSHAGRTRCKGSGLRLTDPFHGMTHRLTNGIERHVFLLAQADEEQPFDRHFSLRVIDQHFRWLLPSNSFAAAARERAAQGLIDEWPQLLLGETFSFAMREHERLLPASVLRPPDLAPSFKSPSIFLHAPFFHSSVR